MKLMLRITSNYRISGWLLAVVFVILATSITVASNSHGADIKSSSPMVLSIVPSQAEPGSMVSLSLTKVPDGMKLMLGGEEVPWKFVDERRINFTISPKTQPGQYSLSVHTENGITRSYSFTVIPLRPVAVSISPDRITSCVSNEVREVTVNGRNFTASSQLLFDGAIIRSRTIPPDTIHFTAPPTRGGLHKIAVKNGDQTTTPLGLSIISAPEISAVSIGADHVSSYELTIEGDNFQQTSALLVNGVRVDTAGSLQGELLVYVDCTKLIYQRRPYSSTPRKLRLQVINPDGEASKTIVVSAP